jgi:hypothetical protein
VKRSVGTGLLEEGLLSLGFVLLVAALLGGLLLLERRTFARAFALDDRRRERERVMWEEDDVDQDQDDSSSVDDDNYDDAERYMFEGADNTTMVASSSIYDEHLRGRVTWQARLLSVNGEEDGRGGVDGAVDGELSSADHSRAGSIASVTSDDGDEGDEASFAMRRLNRIVSAATKSGSTRHH